MINLIVDNRHIQVKPNTSVLQACEIAHAEVPRFCYHDKLSVAGNCRMCLVEIEKSPKPVVSCAMPVMEGMRIYTNTPLVKKAREGVLEFLLINHPLDCPICDQGGECDLQDQTLAYGSDRSRFFEFKRGVEDKECGPIIKTIMTRCIHCTRCVRFAAEVTGLEELGVIGRGENAEIGTYINSFIKTELSGNLVDLCPVGALTSKPYAFIARSWELKKTESVDFFDAVCSSITINTRNSSINQIENGYPKDEILRVLPRLNEELNDEWISDKTRYSFDGLKKQRIVKPTFYLKNKRINSNWGDVLETLVFNIYNNIYSQVNNKKIGGVYGQLSDVESIYYLFQFLNSIGSSNINYQNEKLNINMDIPLFYRFNSTIKSLDESDLILLIGVNPRFEASMVNIRLRQLHVKKSITIGLVGNPVNLTYPYNHLGSSTKTLMNISEGRHNFCRLLAQASNPTIICGTEFLKRKDGPALTNLVRFIGKNIFINLTNNVGYNTLHASVGSIIGCELSAQPGIRSKLHLYNNKKDLDMLFLLYSDNLIKNDWVSFKNKIKRTQTFILDSHINNNNSFADYNLPLTAPYEKTNLLINTEGRVQKSYKAISKTENVREGKQFFQALAKKLNICKNAHSFTTKSLYIDNPSLYNKDKLSQAIKIDFLKFKESQNRIYLSNFLPLINNFYLSDNVSQNSQVMSECSLFLKNKTNFEKNTI